MKKKFGRIDSGYNFINVLLAAVAPVMLIFMVDIIDSKKITFTIIYTVIAIVHCCKQNL